jgi:hypothetical protein
LVNQTIGAFSLAISQSKIVVMISLGVDVSVVSEEAGGRFETRNETEILKLRG